MRRRIRVRSAGGCLRSIFVLAILCVIAVLGVRAIRSQQTALPAADGITEMTPRKNQYVNQTSGDIHRGDLLLVNQDAPYQFDEDIDLISLCDVKHDSYQVKNEDVVISRKIAGPLNDLLDDFYALHHTNAVMVISGYRTYEYQETLLNNEIAQKGEVEAYNWVAVPGHSEHHTGLAIDVCLYDNGDREDYTGTGVFSWINQNAYHYGFIVRYQENKAAVTGISHEPWHFRYVGIPHAYVMEQKGFCYEEYIEYLRDYRYGETHLLATYEGRTWEIYYTQDTEVPVPKDKEYSVSGNNVDGFIVTVTY